MQRRNHGHVMVVLMSILFSSLSAEVYKCLQCDSDDGCRSREECERSCTKKQHIVSCEWEYHECVNVSFSIANQTTGEPMWRYSRKCEFASLEILSGCDFSCYLAHAFNSTNCEARCCATKDNCNGVLPPAAVPLVSSSREFLTSSCHLLTVLLSYLAYQFCGT